MAQSYVALSLLTASCHGAIVHPGFDVTVPHWNDTTGARIESHAAGMLEYDGRWYWYGESKKDGNLIDHGVNLYSAPTLAGPWKNEGQVIKQSMIPTPTNGSNGPFIIERPKVLYNEKTKKFVCWFHLDTGGYKFRHVGIFTADQPIGPFSFVKAMQPDGIPSLDMSLFKDPLDGQAYFIRSCNNAYAGFSRLSDDYLSSTGLISNHSVFEGMAVFRLPNGTFYAMTSHLTGWSPNPLMLWRAAGKTLDDPQWVSMGNPTGDQTSFNTQPTFVVQMTDEKNETYFMYMADNWVHGGPKGLIDASYVWLPIRFGANEVTLSKSYTWDTEEPFAPPPPTPPPPPPTPCHVQGPGQRMRLSSCAKTTPEAMYWSLDGGRLQIGGYCAGSTGGEKQLLLVSCSGGSAVNVTFTSSGEAEVGQNTCFDATWCGDQICDGNYLELYMCGASNGGNEGFSFDPGTGTIMSKVKGDGGDPLCVSVCGDSLT